MFHEWVKESLHPAEKSTDPPSVSSIPDFGTKFNRIKSLFETSRVLKTSIILTRGSVRTTAFNYIKFITKKRLQKEKF
jgi:hypothetical protein